MSNANKLLDMLKSAATPPAASPSQPTIQHPTGPSSLLSPPATTSASPREPSPAPPPPSLQAVSLSDLFAGLTSPPTSTVPAGSTTAPPKEENHQANLLGMLKGINTVPSSGPGSAGQTPGAGRERTVSGNSTPFATATPTTEKSLNGGEHRTNMLNMLKSPLSNGGGLPQPVIVHRTGGSASSGSAQPSPSRPSHVVSPLPAQPSGTVAASNGASAQHVSIPSVPTPSTTASNRPTPPPAPAPATIVSPPVPAASAAQPTKSMFDFVSPFDVFEKPKPKQQQQQEKKEAPVPAPSSTPNGRSTVTPQDSSPVPPSLPKATPPPPPQATKPTQAPLGVKNEPRQRQPSASAQGADGKKDLGLPWLTSKVIEKGVQGKGPKDGTKDIIVDLSRTNVEGLVNAPGTVQITPMTILRADNPSFSKGRSVGITSTWVAYVLSKGRVRLIDSNTGSRLVLQIPGVTNGMALDIAVIADSIALVGPDHSVSVFKVPEHWDKDEPATELITHISAAQPDVEGTGSPNRVEWVRKDGGSYLAIGGDSGVIVIKPDQLKGERDLTIGHLESQNKVLKTEGPLAAFCLNHSHQAIGLVSTKGHFTLYNVNSLSRVWHRILPASQNKPSAPSSVHFVESNVLVGRDNNTQFDLVQLTVDIAVLTTIKFTSPPPSPAHLHFAHVAYDPNRTTLWIAPFSRGSVYGLRYALKGQPQIKVSERPDAVVFDKIAEYPLEPVTGLVVNAKTPEDDAELFFATPNGFSIAQIEGFSTDDAARAVEASVPTPAAAPVSRNVTPVTQPTPAAGTQSTPAVDVKKEKGEGKKGGKGQKNATPSKGNSPAAVKAELPSVPQPALAAVETVPDTSGDLKRLIEEQFAQVNGRIDAFRNGDLAAEIATKVEKSLKSSLASAVQVDVKRSLTATISTSVQNEVKSALTSSAPQAVSAALSSFPKDLERALTPWIQRTVGSVVQTSVDRALDGVLQATLLPAITASSARVAEQLSAEFKSEMVQIRKDFTHSRQETPRNDDALRTLVSLVTDLQRQVQILSERSAAPPAPATSHRPGLPQNQPPQPPQPQPQHGSGSGLPFAARAIEDHFMGALTASSTPATLQLVDEHFYMTEDLLPPPPGKSPLSQPLLLTLSHRLSVALTELSQARPGDTRVAVIANWLKRLSHLVDVRNPDVSAYYGKVVPIVLGALESAAQRVGAEPTGRYAVGDLREAADVFSSKL